MQMPPESSLIDRDHDGSEASYEYLPVGDPQRRTSSNEQLWKDALCQLQTQIQNIRGAAAELVQTTRRVHEDETGRVTQHLPLRQSKDREGRTFLWWIAGIFLVVFCAHGSTVYLTSKPAECAVNHHALRREMLELLETNAELLAQKNGFIEAKAAAEERLTVLKRQHSQQQKTIDELQREKNKWVQERAQCVRDNSESSTALSECLASYSDLFGIHKDRTDDYWKAFRENKWLNETLARVRDENSILSIEKAGLEMEKVNLMIDLTEAEKVVEILKQNALTCRDDKKRFQKALELYGWTLGDYDYMTRAVQTACYKHCKR